MNRKRGWKKPILERAKAILNSAFLNVALEGADDTFLRELIALHPEATDKIGVGIDRFEVRANDWNGLTFWLVRHDGSETDFSYIKALSPSSPMQDFRNACRNCVVDQILEFKQTAFASGTTLTCPITGESVTWQTVHIDHTPPWTFEEIAKAFAATRADIKADIEPTRDGDLYRRFVDESVATAFSVFHRERAVLRAVSRKANLSILKKGQP